MFRVRQIAIAGALAVAGMSMVGRADAQQPPNYSIGVQQPARPTLADVSLAPGGLLRGYLLSDNGTPRANAELVLVQDGREVVRTVTDGQGAYQISGLRGGIYTIATFATHSTVRLWTEGTAPPAAQQLLVVAEKVDVARGQNGGALWRTVTNPWVTAGLIGAAIAVPIALNNNDSGS